MPVIQGLGWTFDTVAEAYGKLRPGGVITVFDTIDLQLARKPE